GDRLHNLRRAREAIARLATNGETIGSPIYETEAVNCELDAPPFYNAILELDYNGSACELLRHLRTIEAELGRPADHPRNQSRTIDLDLLYFGEEQIDTPELRLPHPRSIVREDRKSTRLNSSHDQISYAVFCLKKKRGWMC